MEEDSMIKRQEELSGGRKFVYFLIIVGICMFAGNIILLLMALAGGLSIADGLDIFAAIAEPKMKPYIKTGIALNHLVIFTGAAVFFAYFLRKQNWKSYFYTKPIDGMLLSSFLLLLLCAYPIIGASASVFEGVEWAKQFDEGSMDSLMKLLSMDGVFDLLVNLVVVALLPAIGEELLFRGVIQKELVAGMKNHHVAIILASIIFSGFHLQIQGFLPKLIIGLILGYAYYWTKSIWYPMILHFVNNAIPTLILYATEDKIEEMQEQAIQPEKLYLIIGVVFSCFLCYLIITNIRNQIDEKRSSHV